MGWFGRRVKQAVRLESISTSAALAARLEAEETSVLSMERQATVFSCIQVRGEGFAQLGPKVFLRASGDRREEASKHWAWKLWRESPARDMTPFEFQERISNDLDTTGNFLAYKVKSGGAVRELVPLPVAEVKAERNKSTRRVEYTIEGFTAGGRSTFTRDQIFHVRRRSRNGVWGLSPLTECRLAVSGLLAAETHGRATFQNGAHPSGVVEYPEIMDDAEYARLQEDFDRNWNGERAGRTLILEGGAKFVPIAISNKDAQFLEARQAGKSEICGIFRVPPHMVGDLTRSTNNNIEHQGIEWVMWSLLPLARRVETSWNADPDMLSGGVYLEFNVDSVIRGDFKTRMEGYGKAIERGILTPNEVRAMENRPPMDDGKQLMMMANVTSLEKAIAGNTGAGSTGLPGPADDGDAGADGEGAPAETAGDTETEEEQVDAV